MNVLHMKYAVEVARIGSINKASEELYIAQPNLSRSIKELESDLGITIFNRTSKGMYLTPEGESFIKYAKKALNQIDEIEKVFKSGGAVRKHFSITVPRASYISDAFAIFTKTLENTPTEVFYMEGNSSKAINNILSSDYKLGIIRYAGDYDRYYKEYLEEKGLAYEIVAEFEYLLVMSKDNPLADKEDIMFDDLSPYVEISHGDPDLPSMPFSAAVKKEETPEKVSRHIYLFERASQFELLTENPETFMWVSPLPQKLLDRYGLIQKKCSYNDKVYKDVLIRKKDYVLSDLDKNFITELCASRRKCVK